VLATTALAQNHALVIIEVCERVIETLISNLGNTEIYVLLLSVWITWIDVVPAKKRDSKNTIPQQTGSMEHRIRGRYDRLPASERKVADLILEFPGEMAMSSATELAALADSSKAAVTRLIRRLGYSGFEQARRSAREAQNWDSPLYLMPRVAAPQQGHERIQHHIEQDIRNISKTFESLDIEILDRIVEAMWRSRRVMVIGYRNSHYLAGYLRLQMLQVREGIYLLPEAGETLAEYLAGMTKQDLLIAIGFRRRVPEIKRALDAAIAAGSRTVYITDSTAKVPAGVSWTVPCSIRGDAPVDRYAGAMSLLHFLSVALMGYSDDKGRNRLKSIEQLYDTLHEFG